MHACTQLLQHESSSAARMTALVLCVPFMKLHNPKLAAGPWAFPVQTTQRYVESGGAGSNVERTRQFQL